MIPFPDPKLCPRTPGHKLYYKARRRFCKMENPKSRGEIFTRRPMIFQKDAPDAEIGPTRAKISICNFCPAVLYYLILNPFRRCAIVAQLDRAFGSDPEGQRFESSRSHQGLLHRFCAAVLFCFIAALHRSGTNFYRIYLAKAALCLIIEAMPRCARARFYRNFQK